MVYGINLFLLKQDINFYNSFKFRGLTTPLPNCKQSQQNLEMPGKYEYIRSGRSQNQRRNVDEDTSLQNRIASFKVQPTVHLPVVPRPCFRTAQCSCFPNAPDFSTNATVIAAVQNLLLRRKTITEFPQQDDQALTMDEVIAHPAVLVKIIILMQL